MISLALAFLRRYWAEALIVGAFALLLLLLAGVRSQANHYKAQRDDARTALAYVEALGKREAERALAAEKAAREASAAAKAIRETANADVDTWQRMAAGRDRALRLCYAAPRGGAVPEAGDGREAGAAGGTVSRPVGEDLAGLVADADRLRNALAECYAVDDANRAAR